MCECVCATPPTTPPTTVCMWKSEDSLQYSTFYHVDSGDQAQAIRLNFNLLNHLASLSLANF